MILSSLVFSEARFVPVGTRSRRGARLGRQATGLPEGRVRRARDLVKINSSFSLDPETAREFMAKRFPKKKLIRKHDSLSRGFYSVREVLRAVQSGDPIRRR